MQIFNQVVVTLLLQIYEVVGNFGLAIILFTLLIRLILLPLTMKSLSAQNEMKKIQPELEKLKKKHNGDAKDLQQKQMELYKKYNVNPMAGCLPQLVQFGVLIVLYRVFIDFLGHGLGDNGINPSFLWLDVTQPDMTFILPVLAGASQMVFSLMLAPGGEVLDLVKNDSKSKKIQEENKKEKNAADMAKSMQQQMMFIFPVMTFFIALRFPSGLALYWVTTTLASIAQQWIISGPGGLLTYPARLKQQISNFRR